MLTVTNPVGPLVRVLCQKAAAGLLVEKLMRGSASFYAEPYPNGQWLIMMAPEHRQLIPATMAGCVQL